MSRIESRRGARTTGTEARAVLACLGLSIALGACGSGGPAPPVPAESVRRVVESPPLDQVHWGIFAVDLESGRVVHALNPDRKFVPASNAKLLVTAAALHRFGPEHRFHTSLWAAGSFDANAGVLDGDLVVRGEGDPTLSERFWPDDRAALEALADSLGARGLRRVTGSLVVDASTWDSTTVASTWMAGNLPWSYSATGGAFAVAEGETTLVVRGGEVPGRAAAVEWSPVGEESFVRAAVTTVPDTAEDDLDISYLPESRRLQVTGTIRAGTVDTLSVATRDPVRQAGALLHRILSARDVEVAGGWSVAWDPGRRLGGGCSSGGLDSCAEATRLAALTSPPLMEVVEEILEPSQNWMTEQVVRMLGASDTTRASWRTGLEVVASYLVDTVGADSLDFSLRDGSGLSAYNLVTPRLVVGVLRDMAARPWGQAYREALAEPGEEDSTLEGRLEALEGRLFAKTGTISNVNSLGGYLRTAGGREVVFSILTNGSGLPSRVVREGMDRVVRMLAGGEPSPATR